MHDIIPRYYFPCLINEAITNYEEEQQPCFMCQLRLGVGEEGGQGRRVRREERRNLIEVTLSAAVSKVLLKCLLSLTHISNKVQNT